MDEKTRTAAGDTHELGIPDEATSTVFDVPVLTQLDYLAPSERTDSLGRLGSFEILSVIGKSVSGLVFKAHDTRVDRLVALKPLSPELAADTGLCARFLRAAQAALVLNDPHIVTTLAVANEAPVPWLVTELLDGTSLRGRIESAGVLRLREILQTGSQIAAGLAAAHKLGLIHSDLKPANVLLDPGLECVKISDFGLAVALDNGSGALSGSIAGTPQYMSPERVQGEAIDARSDLFSLGSVLYAMCTGRSPFRGVTLEVVVRRICIEAPRPIHEVNPDIPPFLSDIINRLLSKNPKDRFQSAFAVQDVLEQHLARLHPSAVLQVSQLEEFSKAASPSDPVADVPRGSGCLARGGAAVLLVALAAATGFASRRPGPAQAQHRRDVTPTQSGPSARGAQSEVGVP